MNPQQRAFLAAFRETGNVRLACEVAGVGRSSHYRWLEKDPEYREAFELAKDRYSGSPPSSTSLINLLVRWTATSS